MTVHEDDLIRAILARAGSTEGVLGIGDDACVWTPGGPTCLSTDTVVEGRHFTSETPPADVGRKAAAAALSDLAAMGAAPVGSVVALTCPARWDGLAVMEAVMRELGRHGCRLLGGDTTGGESLVITVTVWGEAAKGRFLTRSGGHPGDLLAVTGALGGSLASGRHLRPEPRLAEGQWLAGHPAVHACMDLSDGLAIDAGRLAVASGCGALLLPKQVPVHDDVPPISDTARSAFCDGEDFELLVAIAAEQWPHVQLAWPFSEPIMVVGWLTDSGRMEIEDAHGRVVPMPYEGFQHRL